MNKMEPAETHTFIAIMGGLQPSMNQPFSTSPVVLLWAINLEIGEIMERKLHLGHFITDIMVQDGMDISPLIRVDLCRLAFLVKPIREDLSHS